MKVSFVIFICLFSQSLWAETIKTSRADEFLNEVDQSWYVILNLATSSATIDHANESSSVSGFNAIGGETSLSTQSFLISITKEFRAKKRFSFSLTGFAGLNDGSGRDSTDGVDSQQGLDGQSFGLDVSANLNYVAYSLKLQPFLGVGASQETSSFTTEYTTGGNLHKNQYDYSGTLADISAGIRFFDPAVNLMSFFRLSFVQPLQQEVTGTTAVGLSTGPLSNGSVNQSTLRASLGFGYMF